MSSEEYLNLVKEFELVYDHYGSYVAEDLSLMNSADLTDENGTVSTQWKSGEITNGEYTESRTHEYITAIACTVLNNDKGFFSTDTGANIIIALCISLASMLPDTDEYKPAFVGHFYDPDTQKNYVGSAANTARTNAEKHFKAALLSASNGAMDEAYEHLGRCLHYVQDVNVPHHAANVTNIPNISHALFEKHAFENQEAYLENFKTIPASNYRNAYSWNIGTITHKAAAEAKPMISHVNNILDKSEWSEYARITMQNATRYSAMAIYRFAMESSLTLY